MLEIDDRFSEYEVYSFSDSELFDMPGLDEPVPILHYIKTRDTEYVITKRIKNKKRVFNIFRVILEIENDTAKRINFERIDDDIEFECIKSISEIYFDALRSDTLITNKTYNLTVSFIEQPYYTKRLN